MSLAERLKQIREKLGYTQKEMAKAVSVILQTWQVYEAGKSVPGGNILEALARLGFNVNWILTGDGPIRLSEGEKNRLLFEEAHDFLRESIKDKLASGGWNTCTTVLSHEHLRSYVFSKEYMPTTEELLELCRVNHIDDYCKHRKIDYEDYISTITNKNFGRSEAPTRQAQKVSQTNYDGNNIELDTDVMDAINRLLNEKSLTYGELSGGKTIIIMNAIYRIYSRNFIESDQFRIEAMEKTIDALFRLALPIKEQVND